MDNRPIRPILAFTTKANGYLREFSNEILISSSSSTLPPCKWKVQFPLSKEDTLRVMVGLGEDLLKESAKVVLAKRFAWPMPLYQARLIFFVVNCYFY